MISSVHLRTMAFLFVFVCSFAPAFAVSGIAVSVSWRTCHLDWGWCVPEQHGDFNHGWRPHGAVVKYAISDSRVVSVDTIASRSQRLCQYPKINVEGTRVAFFCSNAWVSGTDLVGADDSSFVGIVDIDGGNFRTLVPLEFRVQEESALDWPAGDWIYYLQPSAVDGGNQVWRVNYRTGQAEMVCRLNWDGADVPWVRRFTMSTTGEFVGIQPMGNTPCANEFFAFPPLTGDMHQAASRLGGTDCGNTNCCVPGCNAALSAGAGMYAHYFAGRHECLYVGAWDHATDSRPAQRVICLNEVASDIDLTEDDLGIVGCELIRFSTNSELWVLQNVGWFGHAGNLRSGANQILLNWKDRTAIRITDNPKTADPQQTGLIQYGNCTGDFWVDGGPDGTYWQDTTGAWQHADGGQTGVRASVGQTSYSSGPIGIRLQDGVLSIDGRCTGECRVRIVDTRGSLLWQGSLDATRRFPTSVMPGTGAYIVRVTVPGTAWVGSLLVVNR